MTEWRWRVSAEAGKRWTGASACVMAIALGLTGCRAAEPEPSTPAAASASAKTSVPDVEGGWTRLDLAGSGSFGGLADHISPAALTPQGTSALQQQQAGGRGGAGRGLAYDENRRHAAGEAYIVTNGGCTLPGGIEPNSAAFHIVQSQDEVMMVRENPGLHRNVYMDGRSHPNVARWTPTATGHSIGRYENGALIVETVGLTAGAVPAGGYRTPETRLTETYRVSEGGKRLTITYTWEDPKIYQKPHTYDIAFERLPPGAYALEWWCDSSDPHQRESIVPPEQ
jgi:hypothetical protein